MCMYMAINNITFGAKISSIPSIKNVSGKQNLLKDVKLSGYNAFIGGDVYTPSGKIVKQDLLFKDNLLIATDEFDEEQIREKINYVILKDKTIAPAIFDEHIHGGYGVNFHNSSEADIRMLLKKLANEGTGAVIATMLPDKAEEIKKQIRVLNNIIKNPDEGSAKVFGIHLEGPFINMLKRGIHPSYKFLEPSVETYESFEPENVKIVTLAPETDKEYKLSKYLKEQGVIVSAGHSLASAKQVIDAGIKQVTHLFNAMSQFNHREPTIANEGLANPEVLAEMNSDESLLIPQTMNLIMKAKPKDKLVLISDALPQAGIKQDFVMNDVVIHVDENWVAKDDNNILAGSMRFLHDIAGKIIKDTDMTFRNFIRYASENPAKNIGVYDKFKIKEGFKPIFSVWDNKTTKVEKTFIN